MSYDKEAVDQAIRRSPKKIGGREGKLIHRLLQGRHGKEEFESPAGIRQSKAIAKSMQQARDQLNKETERGEHRPSVGGYTDHKHGGES